MACEPIPVDSMEQAIYERGQGQIKALKAWTLEWDYPFKKQGKHMTHVWKRSGSILFRTVMKGAVEGVLEHCHPTQAELSEIEKLVKQFASEGNRGMPIGRDRNQDVNRRSPLTSHDVAEQSGIKHSHEFLFTGNQLAKMDLSHRREAYLKGAIFSSVLPEQKYEMVKFLRDEGRIVAMTGDGINDAPALKLADVGISMGHSATDVARSAAQIVLLDSDFSGIVVALLEGRRILFNLGKSFSYLISFHVPAIILTLVPPLLGWNPLLMPVHIILLELIVHPVSAFTFENLSIQGNKRFKKSADLISRKNVQRALLSGLLVSLGALFLFQHFSKFLAVDTARTCAFSAVLIGNIAFTAIAVWPQFNLRFAITAFMLTLFVGMISLMPFTALHFLPMDARLTAIALAVGILGLVPAFFFCDKPRVPALAQPSVEMK